MKLLHSTIIGHGQTLIIAHGYFGMGDNWRSMAVRFSEHFEVHSIDQRNHGKSFHTDDFNYEILVEDLYHYIKHYKLRNVIILGHSMGGKMAMLFAVTYPEMVNKLIVVDIAPKYYSPHHEFILKALNAVDFEKINTRREVEAVLKSHIDTQEVVQFLLKNVYWKSKGHLAFRFNLESLTENNNEVGEALPPFTNFDKAALFLKGALSGYLIAADVSLINTHFSHAEIVTINNAGHWIHADNPEDFYKNVYRFITQ
ncbi:MAG: alpha/beta fold hydrolase [Flavobacteriaceae bacterium]|nr:alpha/beta fold hydrolase [Flavobacteriaceae bacterium]